MVACEQARTPSVQKGNHPYYERSAVLCAAERGMWRSEASEAACAQRNAKPKPSEHGAEGA
jgi:hypothetical protein